MVSRRGFVQFCATFLASLRAAPPAFADQAELPFARVNLVDEHAQVLPASQLEPGVNYLFHYPFVSTPCFLLRLDHPAEPTRLATEQGRGYGWEGGVGPGQSIVAYSAICAHKMTHPARSVSFINYRPQPVAFRDRSEQTTRRGEIIYCCSERSVYDAAQGARVLGGPAPQPLAAIRLEHDPAQDALYACGVYGGALFDRYFREFGDRLMLEFGTTDIKRTVQDTARVMRLEEYTRNQMLC
jgi:Rieske Fe-S protein